MTATQVAIIGCGGHARVVLHALRSTNVSVLTLTDLTPENFPHGLDGCPVIRDEELLERYPCDRVSLAYGVGSISAVGDAHPRRRIVDRFRRHGYSAATVVHAAAYVADGVLLDQGAQIHAGAVIQPGVSVGACAIVNTRASVDHDCCIGPFVHIAPGATLSGNVTVKEGAHVGTGASVIQGVTIGRCATVAAGACVVRDVADHSLVMGVPARVVARGRTSDIS